MVVAAAAAAAVDPIVAVVCSVPAHQRNPRLVAVAEAVWLYSHQIHQKGYSFAAEAAVAVCSDQDPRIDYLLVEAAVGCFDPDRQRDLRSAAGAVFAAWIQIDLNSVGAVGCLHLDFQTAQLTVAVEMCLCSY